MLGCDFEIIYQNGEKNMLSDAISIKYDDVKELLCEL